MWFSLRFGKSWMLQLQYPRKYMLPGSDSPPSTHLKKRQKRDSDEALRHHLDSPETNTLKRHLFPGRNREKKTALKPRKNPQQFTPQNFLGRSACKFIPALFLVWNQACKVTFFPFNWLMAIQKKHKIEPSPSLAPPANMSGLQKLQFSLKT